MPPKEASRCHRHCFQRVDKVHNNEKFLCFAKSEVLRTTYGFFTQRCVFPAVCCFSWNRKPPFCCVLREKVAALRRCVLRFRGTENSRSAACCGHLCCVLRFRGIGPCPISGFRRRAYMVLTQNIPGPMLPQTPLPLGALVLHKTGLSFCRSTTDFVIEIIASRWGPPHTVKEGRTFEQSYRRRTPY